MFQTTPLLLCFLSSVIQTGYLSHLNCRVKSRHCEERSDEAISWSKGLLQGFALRNDLTENC